MEYISWFIFDFILIFIIYYFMFIRKARRGVKIPTEAQYLINLYKLDTKLFSYHKFLLIVGIVTSFDIAVVATIVTVVKGFVFQILFGLIAVIPIIGISFLLLGKYYQKKQTKDNKKDLEKEKRFLDKLDKKENKKNSKKKKKGR